MVGNLRRMFTLTFLGCPGGAGTRTRHRDFGNAATAFCASAATLGESLETYLHTRPLS